MANEYGLQLNHDKLKAYQSKVREMYEKEIFAAEKRIQGYKKSIEEIDSMYLDNPELLKTK